MKFNQLNEVNTVTIYGSVLFDESGLLMVGNAHVQWTTGIH